MLYGNNMTTHRDSERYKLYNVWRSMKDRCDNPKNKAFASYGGRGISYDVKWQDFNIFLAEMEPRPTGMELDRIDNDSSYCKQNCRWTTRQVQLINQRLSSRNTSGIKGVTWNSSNKKNVTAYCNYDGKMHILYWGPDFFEACCRRRSWENKRRYVIALNFINTSEPLLHAA